MIPGVHRPLSFKAFRGLLLFATPEQRLHLLAGLARPHVR